MMPVILLAAQLAQNPSPMVEHGRSHERLVEKQPEGKRIPLERGQLFLPRRMPRRSAVPLVFHFHGNPWIAETAASQAGNPAVISLQLGAGSSVYAAPFQDAALFGRLLDEAQQKSGLRFDPVCLSSWSAGYGAIREILQNPDHYSKVQCVIAVDSIHASYLEGKPGPLESRLDEGPLSVFVRFARDASIGAKRMIIAHTEIFPGTFASTTETADYLLASLDLRRRPILRWAPFGMQQISEARRGRFHVLGFAGNTAPDHIDQLHALGWFWKLAFGR